VVFSRSGLSSSPSRFLRAGWLVCLVPGRRLMSPTVMYVFTFQHTICSQRKKKD
jgi:hypothetical protein